MLRIGTNIFLMVMTLAGPVVCPCSAAQLLAPRNTSEEQAPPAPSCPCCHRLPAPSTTLPPGDQKPVPKRASCPCQLHGQRVHALTGSRLVHTRTSAVGEHVELLPDVLLWSSFGFLASTSGAPDASGRPFYDPKDFLHVFHLLRC